MDRLNRINEEGQRAFLYGITMENHQPYKPEKFRNQSQVSLTADSLSQEDQTVLRSMLEGIVRAGTSRWES